MGRQASSLQKKASFANGLGIKVKSSLRVSDFMRSNPWCMHLNDPLKKAADIIVNRKIDGVPITDDKGQLVGLITKTLVLREIMAGTDLKTPVSEVMIKDVITIDPEEDISALITVNIGNLPVVDEGKAVGIVTLSDTIRAYFSSSLALREELDAVINSAHNGIVTVNEEGKIILINSAAEELLAVKRQEVLGRHVDEVMPGNRLIDVLCSGMGDFGQKIAYRDRRFMANHSPIMSDGGVIGAVAVFQDISELEQISEELTYTKQMKEELEALIDSSFDGIHVTDGEGTTLRVNDSFLRIMGVTSKDVMGKSCRELEEQGIYMHPIIDTVLSQRKACTFSQESPAGNTILVTANPVFDSGGNVIRVVINIRDMTELERLKRELELAQTLSQHYEEELYKIDFTRNYVIRSHKTRELMNLCVRLGQVDTTVLIQGESGVGKEVFARLIHLTSSRKSRPLVSINCAAIPENLLESELFGYVSGAFTGASKEGKPGLFETASGGTLFLDEVGELPLNLQAKILRVIQNREITRIGSTKPIEINVRIIAATNRDLWEMVERKEFRKDLYYRLNVVPVIVPPLRERKEEIPFLVAHFLNKFNSRYGLYKKIDEAALEVMMDYDWPGNVRELENLIERLVVTCPEDVIRNTGLPQKDAKVDKTAIKDSVHGSLKKALEDLEKSLIEKSLSTHGSTRRAAKELGVSQSTVVRKAFKYGIRLPYH